MIWNSYRYITIKDADSIPQITFWAGKTEMLCDLLDFSDHIN